MAKDAKPSLQASGAFAVTPSDANDIVLDAANTKGYKFVYLHVAGTSGAIKVNTADGETVTVYGTQGQVLPLMVSRVWSTGTAATSIIAFVGRGGTF